MSTTAEAYQAACSIKILRRIGRGARSVRDPGRGGRLFRAILVFVMSYAVTCATAVVDIPVGEVCCVRLLTTIPCLGELVLRRV